MSLIALTPSKPARTVKYAVLTALQTLSNQVYTLTYENGKEFALHADRTKELEATGFLAHHASPWERGLDEKCNGLIGPYLPEGTDCRALTQLNVQSIMANLNNRPGNCLGFKTPNQVFFGTNQTVPRGS